MLICSAVVRSERFACLSRRELNFCGDNLIPQPVTKKIGDIAIIYLVI
jgi:hypothetical protein